MPKEEIYNFLKKANKYVSARQVSRGVNKTLMSTNRILKSMVKWKEVDVVERKLKVGKSKHKRPIRYFRLRK